MKLTVLTGFRENVAQQLRATAVDPFCTGVSIEGAGTLKDLLLDGYLAIKAQPEDQHIGKALHAAVSALHLGDSSDYEAALWDVIRNIAPHLVDQMEVDSGSVYALTLPEVQTEAEPEAV
jgi:hypothetical protein